MAYDPVDESWQEAKPRLLSTKVWRCAPALSLSLFLPLPRLLLRCASSLPSLLTAARHRREPTQAELNNASESLVGKIICIEGHGPGKVTEFLDNGSWGVKSGHMIDFGDPFGEGGGEPNAKEVKLKRKKNVETEWLRYIGSAGGGGGGGGFGAKKKAGGFAKKKSYHGARLRRIFTVESSVCWRLLLAHPSVESGAGLPPGTPQHTLDIFKEANRLSKQQHGKGL